MQRLAHIVDDAQCTQRSQFHRGTVRNRQKLRIACTLHLIHVRAVFIHHSHWCDDDTWMWEIAARWGASGRGSCAKNRFKCWIMHSLLAHTRTRKNTVYQPRRSSILQDVQRAAFNTRRMHTSPPSFPFSVRQFSHTHSHTARTP